MMVNRLISLDFLTNIHNRFPGHGVKQWENMQKSLENIGQPTTWICRAGDFCIFPLFDTMTGKSTRNIGEEIQGNHIYRISINIL